MSEKAGLTSKPKFGEWLRGIYASESNPHRDGMYVRTIRRTGRMNPGTFYELTDGNGRFWQYPAQSVERVAAPQPPAEAQPVAEAVVWLNPDCEFGEPFSNVQTKRHTVPLYTAPPSAPVGDCPDCTNGEQCAKCSRGEWAGLESSAPVGVEGLLAEAAEVGTLCNLAVEVTLDAGLVATADALSKGALTITRLAQALDQQPAAVDGAMVERALNARYNGYDVACYLDEEADGRCVLHAALTAALAGQQGGES